MFKDKKILITGGSGFLGSHLYELLIDKYKAQPQNIFNFPHLSDKSWLVGQHNDLTYRDDINRFLKGMYFDYVFHLAGFNGGINFNKLYPADIFFQNTVMGLNLLDWAAKNKVLKVVSCVASCAYPEYVYDLSKDASKYPRELCLEKEFLDGPCNDTVACHGYAKRNLQLASLFYNKQYGLSATCVCPTTIYGPRDYFSDERSKVMSGLIEKFVKAERTGQNEVVLWGTGKPMREFIYVTDAARLIIESAVIYNDPHFPLNLGTGQESSIKDLAEKIKVCTNYKGNIVWDKTKPDGQYRKRLDLTHMNACLGQQTFISLDDGIQQTVDYYRRTR